MSIQPFAPICLVISRHKSKLINVFVHTFCMIENLSKYDIFYNVL